MPPPRTDSDAVIARSWPKATVNVLHPPNPKAHSGKCGRIPRTKARNLLERLREFEVETLRFLTDPLVPFTNNQSKNEVDDDRTRPITR